MVSDVLGKIMQRLQHELQDATIHQIPDCGHLPHVEKPYSVAKLIADFTQGDRCQEVRFNHFKHVKRPNSVVNSIAEWIEVKMLVGSLFTHSDEDGLSLIISLFI